MDKIELEITPGALEGFLSSNISFEDRINDYDGNIIQAFLKSEVYKKITKGKSWEDLSKSEKIKFTPDLELSLNIFSEGWQALRNGQDESTEHFKEQINAIRKDKGENSIPLRLCKAFLLGLDVLGNGTIAELDVWDGNYKSNDEGE